ncbi:MAG: cytochrome P450 [Woeseiaceae bacterium]|nr:cytochrome P450 [Woeseiaceae bacterium]
MTALYRPPAPQPMTPIRSLIRVIKQGDGDLLSLVPIDAYRKPYTYLGYSRRSILLINDPDIARDVLTDPLEIFPKNDLMVGALEPLVGDSIFVSSGETWRRQRAMIDPAFSAMRINKAFPSMCSAVDDYEDVLDGRAERGEYFSLDLAMSELTADVICRTIFSTSLESQTAREVFESFSEFEDSVASVSLKQLIFGKPWADVRQPDNVLAACERIRGHIGDLLDPRLAKGGSDHDDIVAAVIAARDPETGEGFTREELIDQMGVFFLAGHETTASVLTWVVYILSVRPDVVERIREELDEVVGDGEVEFAHVKQLTFVRYVFREALRLYPPITFIPRVAAERTKIGRFNVKKGAMIMVSPWTAHRNESQWTNAEFFDPDRFDKAARGEDDVGVLMSFGLGPRICIGAAFATIESGLILARLVRRYDFEVRDADRVRPVAKLTTRPAAEVQCRVARRAER